MTGVRRTGEDSTLVVGTTHRSPRKAPAPVIEYQISSYCNGGGCVEVGRTPGGPVVVRDSKDPERRASLVFTAEEWTAFVAGVKNGEFDLA
ncbi:DUF397 domain-containing protein [Pseudonocardia sp. CA-142604]|uniref:DUF397 domain-containing protein n=1 Tax=Pseudonocardia sp. CA-142604 TaxID=3240024 RepID=UPI003D8E7033